MARSGDEGAAAGDALEEALGHQGVQRLAHGHPGDAEPGDELTLGRSSRARRLMLDQGAHMLTHLYMLQGPLTRYHHCPQLLHASRLGPRSGLVLLFGEAV